MNKTSAEWPLQNCTIHEVNRETAERIDVCDSPREDCVSIYYAKGDLRFPCRDVDYTKSKHFHSVIQAWSEKDLPMNDCRTEKSVSLTLDKTFDEIVKQRDKADYDCFMLLKRMVDELPMHQMFKYALDHGYIDDDDNHMLTEAMELLQKRDNLNNELIEAVKVEMPKTVVVDITNETQT